MTNTTEGGRHSAADLPDLTDIAERSAKATPGPWQVLTEELVDAAWINAAGPDDDLPIALFDYRNGDENKANAEFLAHARTDIPRLLEALREARQRIEHLLDANNREIESRIAANRECCELRAKLTSN
ncbi:MAG: hypothetical protein ABWY00_11070 [Dongiaceae bacterium]